jgi:hypothetical protein
LTALIAETMAAPITRLSAPDRNARAAPARSDGYDRARAVDGDRRRCGSRPRPVRDCRRGDTLPVGTVVDDTCFALKLSVAGTGSGGGSSDGAEGITIEIEAAEESSGDRTEGDGTARSIDDATDERLASRPGPLRGLPPATGTPGCPPGRAFGDRYRTRGVTRAIPPRA